MTPSAALDLATRSHLPPPPDPLNTKSGEIWKAVACSADAASGAYVYRYRLRSELLGSEEKISAVQRRIFPALEMRPKFTTAKFDPVRGTEDKALIAFMNRLGYRAYTEDGVPYLELPDARYLRHRWELERETNPDLPLLDILEVTGISSDMDYTRDIILHSAVLSVRGEFPHDHSRHVSLFCRLNFLDPVRYKAELARIGTSLCQRYWSIVRIEDAMAAGISSFSRKDLELVKFRLGALADDIVGFDSFEKLADYTPDFIAEHWKQALGEEWRHYVTQRFDSDALLTNAASSLETRFQNALKELTVQ